MEKGYHGRLQQCQHNKLVKTRIQLLPYITMVAQSIAFAGMTYGLYQRINGTMYFTELAVDIKKTMQQHTEMVDLLILEKKQVLNSEAKPYTPELQRRQNESNQEEENSYNKHQKASITSNKNCVSIINESWGACTFVRRREVSVSSRYVGQELMLSGKQASAHA